MKIKESHANAMCNIFKEKLDENFQKKENEKSDRSSDVMNRKEEENTNETNEIIYYIWIWILNILRKSFKSQKYLLDVAKDD